VEFFENVARGGHTAVALGADLTLAQGVAHTDDHERGLAGLFIVRGV
jgi:hypothetical protein